MKVLLVAAALISGGAVHAQQAMVDCDGAATFYDLSVFWMKVGNDISDLCAARLDDETCKVLHESMVLHGKGIDPNGPDRTPIFLGQLSTQCAGMLPDDPTKF